MKSPLFFPLVVLLAGPLAAQVTDDTDSENTPPAGSTLITSDELHSDQVTHQSIFTGKVIVTGQNFRMTCQEMTVFFTNDNKVTKIVSTGDVIITQPNRVTHCGHAEYYQDTDTFDLTEQPVILDGKNTVKGPEIVIDRKSQKMTVKGPGRTTVIIPDSSMGSATTTPAPSDAGTAPAPLPKK
jgi:lipopolysaccharide export system protein LptA